MHLLLSISLDCYREPNAAGYSFTDGMHLLNDDWRLFNVRFLYKLSVPYILVLLEILDFAFWCSSIYTMLPGCWGSTYKDNIFIISYVNFLWVPKDPINNNSTLVQILNRCRQAKLLSIPMLKWISVVIWRHWGTMYQYRSMMVVRLLPLLLNILVICTNR